MISGDDIEAMSDDVELLPCPFCGGYDLVYRAAIVGDSYYCSDCKAYGPISTPDNIKARWNTRANVQHKPQ